jgi:uncharacterized protein
MKSILSKIILIALFIGCVSAQNKDTIFVFDRENVFTEAQELEFTQLLLSHQQKTGNEIAIVTTPDLGEHQNLMQFAVDFGDKFGVGTKEKNNGVVIVFSQTLREIRIATGYGTEELLTDKIVKSYIDSLMVPAFIQQDFFEGIYAGSKAIVDFLEMPENEIK